MVKKDFGQKYVRITKTQLEVRGIPAHPILEKGSTVLLLLLLLLRHAKGPKIMWNSAKRLPSMLVLLLRQIVLF